LEDAKVEESKNQSKNVVELEKIAAECENAQNEFSDYMDRLKDDIDFRAENFEKIEYFEGSLRDGEAQKSAMAGESLDELDPRRRKLIKAGSHLAKYAKMPPELDIDNSIDEGFQINLNQISDTIIKELNQTQQNILNDQEDSRVNVTAKDDSDDMFEDTDETDFQQSIDVVEEFSDEEEDLFDDDEEDEIENEEEVEDETSTDEDEDDDEDPDNKKNNGESE
jgi:hypothetical protein